MSNPTILKKLAIQLYPTGKAMRVPVSGYKEGLHKALALSEAQALSDSKAVLNSILPDNDLFTEADAADWERRLGLISNPDVDLADRKAAIKRKMNHPGTIKARQHYLYLQSQLRAAGFDVYVYENRPEIDPMDYIADASYGELGDDSEMGEIELGDAYTVYASLYEIVELGEEAEMGEVELNDFFFKNKVVNCIGQEEDLYFSVGSNYRSIFFIGGSTFGTFANVVSEREAEFRQLILRIKPAQTVAYLFINYT